MPDAAAPEREVERVHLPRVGRETERTSSPLRESGSCKLHAMAMAYNGVCVQYGLWTVLTAVLYGSVLYRVE